MDRHNLMIERALDVARSSKLIKFKHGAILTHNRTTLAVATNLWRCSPGIDYLNSTVHAEKAVLRKITVSNHITLYVARVNRCGEPMLSKPCDRCWALLLDSGVEDVVWSESNGTYSACRLR